MSLKKIRFASLIIFFAFVLYAHAKDITIVALQNLQLNISKNEVEQKFGLPEENQTENWGYKNSFSKIFVTFKNDKVTNISARFNSSQHIDTYIPRDFLLQQIEFANTSDVLLDTIWVGNPTSGQIWEITRDKNVLQYNRIPTWKATAKLRSRDSVIEDAFKSKLKRKLKKI